MSIQVLYNKNATETGTFNMISKIYVIIMLVFLLIITAWFFACESEDDEDNEKNDSANDDTTDDDDSSSDDDAADDDDDSTDGEFSLVFLHHSVGQNWVDDGGISQALAAENIDFYDITYGDGWIGDNTEPWDWPETFTTYYNDVLGWDLPAGDSHDIVMIKSCYPNSALWSPDDIATTQGYYNSLLDAFEDHPETGFLVMTSPPYADSGEVTDGDMALGRQLAYWLTEEWAQGVANVRVVDLAGYLNDDFGFSHDRTAGNGPFFYLRNECEVEPDNSHPTGACLSAANDTTVQNALNLL